MDTYNGLIARTRAVMVADSIDSLITNVASSADAETLKALATALEKALERIEATS